MWCYWKLVCVIVLLKSVVFVWCETWSSLMAQGCDRVIETVCVWSGVQSSLAEMRCYWKLVCVIVLLKSVVFVYYEIRSSLLEWHREYDCMTGTKCVIEILFVWMCYWSQSCLCDMGFGRGNLMTQRVWLYDWDRVCVWCEARSSLTDWNSVWVNVFLKSVVFVRYEIRSG